MTATRESHAISGLTAALVYATAFQGGFYVRQTVATLALLGIGLAISGVRSVLPREVLLAFGVLGFGLVVSLIANGFTEAAVKPLLTLAIAICAAEAAARASRVATPRAVFDIVTVVAAGAALVGIAAVTFHLEPFAADADPWRLLSTLTYQNAAAALMVLTVPAALAVAARGRPVHRIAVMAIITALMATLSRGGILSAAIVLVVCAASSSDLRRAMVDPLCGAVVAFGFLIPAMLDARGGIPIAFAGLAVGGWCVVWAARSQRGRIAIRILAAITLIVGMVTVPGTSIRGRLTLATMDRDRVWTQTIEQMDGELLFGTGPGTFRLVAPKDGQLVVTEHAHNEYLQTLSETGVVGLGAVIAALVLFATTLRRHRGDLAYAVAVASGVGFITQSTLDFLWRVPVLVAVVFALYGASMRDRRPETG